MSKQDNDSIQRFAFADHAISGAIVHLNRTYLEVIGINEQIPSVERMIGKFLAAVSLMACRMKFDGVLTLQLKSDGPLDFLVVQTNNQFEIRGNAFCDEESVRDNFEALTSGRGTFSVNLDHKLGKQPYQGMVEIGGCQSLTEVLERYFERSEQLTSKIWLFANNTQVAGLMLQMMPEDNKKCVREQKKYWDHLVKLTDTMTQNELLHLSNEEMLHRLYHQEALKLFEPQATCFKCFCTQGSMEAAMRGMPYQELKEILDEDSCVKVRCEFCNKTFLFDKIDIARIYHKGGVDMKTYTRH